MIKAGHELKAQHANAKCTIKNLIGDGGQGEVYRAAFDGADVAVKWYFPKNATDAQRTALEALIALGPPSDAFLWPIDIVTSSTHTDSFGYVMPLRPSEFSGLNVLMKRTIDPTFATLTRAGFLLTQAFLSLHTRGYCYRDINLDNIFLNSKTGEVLVCDNDNVSAEGRVSGVGGTVGFMAPEVMRNEVNPNIQSDQFSLAVLLFHMFFVAHPFHGRLESQIHCLDLSAKLKLYGTHPRFIFDPNDQANAPVAGMHDNALAFWPIYPLFFKQLFVQTFTEGLQQPHRRTVESQWRQGLVRLRDSIFRCASCGSENFYDMDSLVTRGAVVTCWHCRRQTSLPMRMRIGDNVTMVNHDTKLFPHHIGKNRLYDFSAPVAAVVKHPSIAGAYGLKNLSRDTWTTADQGESRSVGPGQSVTLLPGLRLFFGGAVGEVNG